MAGNVLRVQATEEATVFNPTHVANGAAKTAAVAGLLLGAGAIPTAAVIGAVAGGIGGKREMERDLQVGKAVKDPSYFNRETVMGTALGMAAVPFLGVPGLLVLAAGAAAGGYIGKGRMETEYQEALQQNGAIARTAALGGQGAAMSQPGMSMAQNTPMPSYKNSAPLAMQNSGYVGEHQNRVLAERAAAQEAALMGGGDMTG